MWVHRFCILLFLLTGSYNLFCQENILYQDVYTRDWFSVGFGSYGRIGASWTTDFTGIQGRRLNLNNMGSIGGRHEEQDYLEFGVGFNMKPVNYNPDSTVVLVQLRASVFSQSVALFGNSNTSSSGGLTIALPEMYVEARNVLTKELNLWVGSRLYRGPDVHMADYWVFNDHSSQGFGAEYKGTRAVVSFVATTDTTSTVPPYFFLNIKSGTQSLEIRNRTRVALEQDVRLRPGQLISFLGEYHHIGDPTDVQDTSNLVLSAPGDNGFVFGVRHQMALPGFLNGSFNQFGVRYGTGIANGGDGGSSRTWETFGAVNKDNFKFDEAYSWHIVNHLLVNFSKKFSLNAYGVYNQSKGAAETKGLAETYFDREVWNYKEDFSMGFKGVNYITDVFHWQTEVHYSQRRDGEQPWYRMAKLSLVPTLAIMGERSVWSRPHIRFVYSMAFFNEFAQEDLYSPFLELTGPRDVGHYFGIKAEWWTW